jgi:hypothetical protein
MIRLRRRLSRGLVSLAAIVSPDPPLKFTTVSAVKPVENYALTKALADIIGGHIVGYGRRSDG